MKPTFVIAALALALATSSSPANTYSASPGKTPFEVVSLRLNGEMRIGSQKLELTVFKRIEGKIRAVIKPTGSTGELHYVLSEGMFFRIKESGTVREVEELDASGAEILFDLIALSPDFHFLGNKIIDLPQKVFGEFEIRLTRGSEREIGGIMVSPPAEMTLYRKKGDDFAPLRRTEFLKFDTARKSFLQPTCFRFVDLASGDSGTIELHSVEFNAGIADFLFEVEPKDN